MKKYIFIAPTVANMGGAQMYIRNKMLWLKQQGWDVDIIVAQGGAAKLVDLQRFECVVSELAFDILNFSEKKKVKVVNKIVHRIGAVKTDNVVIESTCISETLWAEAVAKRIFAKHFVYLLQEENKINNKGVQDFFLFKLKRKELYGIIEPSLDKMFRPFYQIANNEMYHLPAHSENVEADIDSPFINLVSKSKKDYVVGMFSRLDKPFVIPAIKKFCQYANNHHDSKYLLLVMGDAPEGVNLGKKILNLIKKTTRNVSLVLTGYIYPVPTRLLKLCDVFFSSAGCAWVCARSGVPTIAIDGNDFSPIGILGRTTTHALFRGENESKQDFFKLMDEVLTEKKHKKESPYYKEGLPDFGDHIKALEESVSEKEYFDVESIKPETKMDFKLKYALAVIGPKNYLKLGALKEKWTKRK